MFKKLEGDSVLLGQGGVYKPCDLYEFQGGLFAKTAGGYVRLKANGTTSKDGVSFYHIELESPIFQDRFGRLATVPREGYVELQLCPSEEETKTMFLPAPKVAE